MYMKYRLDGMYIALILGQFSCGLLNIPFYRSVRCSRIASCRQINFAHTKLVASMANYCH